MKLRRASWLVGGGLMVLAWGNVTHVLAQDVICCMRLIAVKGNWFGALRTCDLSNTPPEQRAKLCQQLAGCADAAPYCGVDRPCTETGSLIDIQNQALGERIAVTGTPFSLYYRSDRMRVAGRAIVLPIASRVGASVFITLMKPTEAFFTLATASAV